MQVSPSPHRVHRSSRHTLVEPEFGAGVISKDGTVWRALPDGRYAVYTFAYHRSKNEWGIYPRHREVAGRVGPDWAAVAATEGTLAFGLDGRIWKKSGTRWVKTSLRSREAK